MKRMKKAALFLVIILICTLCPVYPKQANAETDADQAVLDARTGILQVNVGVKKTGSNDEAILISGGSGFLIGTEEGGQYVLTNWHVVDQEENIAAYADESKINKKNLKKVISVVALRDMTVNAEIVKYSKECDVAILKLEQNIYNSTPLILSSKENTQETQTVYALGFPAVIQWGQDVKNYKNTDVTIEKGSISKFSTQGGVDYIVHNSKLSAGNSGGPLVDSNGEVVGINKYSSRKSDEATTFYYSIQIDVVRDMLDALGIQYGKSGETENTVGTTNNESSESSTDISPESTTESLPEVDKGALEAALESAKAEEQDKYTKDSYAALDEAMKAGQEVYDNSEATAEQVSQAVKVIKDAQDNLKENSSMPIILIIAVVAVVLIVIILVVVMGGKKKKKKAASSSPVDITPNPSAGGPVQPAVKREPPQPPTGFTPQPPYVGEGAGETSVLNEGAGETTLLTNQNMPQASLFRISNRENIRINKGNFSIGKERRKVDYCISNNNSISRNHAEIILKNGSFYLIDHKSTNGTYLNEVKLNPLQEMVLKSGDKIRLSDEEFEFKLF